MFCNHNIIHVDH